MDLRGGLRLDVQPAGGTLSWWVGFVGQLWNGPLLWLPAIAGMCITGGLVGGRGSGSPLPGWIGALTGSGPGFMATIDSMSMHSIRRFLAVAANAVLPQKVKAWCVRRVQALESLCRHGTVDFPRSIGIEINAHCNRSCSYCMNSVAPMPAQNMSEAVFSAVLGRMREVRWSGIVRLHFINEPLLRKDLETVVRRVGEAAPASIVHLYTNGDLLTVERCERLIQAGVMNFVVTRHPPFSEKWDRQIAEVRSRFGKYVTWNGELTVLHDWAGELGIESSHGMKTCDMPRDVLQVLVDGRVNLCCVDPSRANTFGSLVDQSIREIWTSPRFVETRKTLRAGKPNLETCVKCLAGGG